MASECHYWAIDDVTQLRTRVVVHLVGTADDTLDLGFETDLSIKSKYDENEAPR